MRSLLRVLGAGMRSLLRVLGVILRVLGVILEVLGVILEVLEVILEVLEVILRVLEVILRVLGVILRVLGRLGGVLGRLGGVLGGLGGGPGRKSIYPPGYPATMHSTLYASLYLTQGTPDPASDHCTRYPPCTCCTAVPALTRGLTELSLTVNLIYRRPQYRHCHRLVMSVSHSMCPESLLFRMFLPKVLKVLKP